VQFGVARLSPDSAPETFVGRPRRKVSATVRDFWIAVGHRPQWRYNATLSL